MEVSLDIGDWVVTRITELFIPSLATVNPTEYGRQIPGAGQ